MILVLAARMMNLSHTGIWGGFRGTQQTSSISPIGVDVVPGNFGNKRNADSIGFLPLKFRKLSGAI
jgi:hypothetical protein